MTPRSGALVALAAAVLATGTGIARAEQTPSQKFFKALLLDDPRTSDAIRGLLRHHRGFVDPHVRFAELTGDKRNDAVVKVSTGGAAGDIALYVFSTDGAKDGKLRAVFRRQALQRVTTTVKKGVVRYRVPKYAAGDDVCCPAAYLERTLTWHKGSKRFAESKPDEIPTGDQQPASNQAPPAG